MGYFRTVSFCLCFILFLFPPISARHAIVSLRSREMAFPISQNYNPSRINTFAQQLNSQQIGGVAH